jgi:acyl-CoA synthetase (AMP-forming)/AMP-acid ligase II
MGYATCPEDLARDDEQGGVVATGDLGYRDRRGLFYITGRRSRFVKLSGWRVSLDELEQLFAHAAPVAAVNDGERLVIYAERAAAAFANDVGQLAQRLNLHPSMFEIREIEALPRLANGKVDYSALSTVRPAQTR